MIDRFFYVEAMSFKNTSEKVLSFSNDINKRFFLALYNEKMVFLSSYLISMVECFIALFDKGKRIMALIYITINGHKVEKKPSFEPLKNINNFTDVRFKKIKFSVCFNAFLSLNKLQKYFYLMRMKVF